jgi:hypothetical protein
MKMQGKYQRKGGGYKDSTKGKGRGSKDSTRVKEGKARTVQY